MNRLSKAILYGLGALLALGILALLALNLYVQSAGAQERIRARLSEALGLPLEINRVSVTPWGGLRLSGITIPSGEKGAPPFLQAPAFIARVPVLSLLRRQVDIDEITVQSPRIVWVQNAEGEWRLPEREKKAVAPQPSAPATKPPGPAPAGTIPPGEPVPPREPAESAPETVPPPAEVRVGLFAVRDGSLDFLDENREPVVTLRDANVRCTLPARDSAEGHLTAAEMGIRDLIHLQNLDAPFTYDDKGVHVRGATAQLAGGTVTADYTVDPTAADAPYTASGRLEAVDLSRLLQESGGRASQASGQLAGSFELAGSSADDSLAGKGHLELRDGRIEQYELLRILGETLRIEELRRLDLQEARADFTIEGGVVKLAPLYLRTANLQLTASGDILPGGTLDLRAQLSIHQKISHTLPQFIEDNFQPSETEPGWRTVAFDIDGTLEKPGTNLVQRMVGSKLEKKVTGFFESFLGGKKEKSDDKKKTKKKKDQ